MSASVSRVSVSASYTVAIDWHGFIEEMRCTIPDIIHPSAQGGCSDRCREMHEAVDAGNIAAFKPLLARFNAIIADELRWEAQKRESIGLPDCLAEAITLRRMADAREAGHV
jgi:hypothetical protein